MVGRLWRLLKKTSAVIGPSRTHMSLLAIRRMQPPLSPQSSVKPFFGLHLSRVGLGGICTCDLQPFVRGVEGILGLGGQRKPAVLQSSVEDYSRLEHALRGYCHIN